jgi:ribosomal protein S18 acetylase RimI-like enzyme
MQVRTATIDDAPAIARVHIRTWQRAYAHVLPAGFLASLDLLRDDRSALWQRSISGRSGPGQVFVADIDGDVAGFAAVGTYRPGEGAEPEPHVGQVFAIYADPDHWSTGTGRALMDAAVAHLAEAGLTEIRLWVLEDNPRARRFYEVAGFTPDGATLTDTIGAGGPYATEVTEVRYTRAVR